MTRRMLWTIIACVVAAAVASLARFPDMIASELAARSRPAQQRGPQQPPELVKHVPAVVPKQLQDVALSETVGIQAVIGPDGKVAATVVFTPSTPALAAAAVDAVKQWEYKPTLLQKVPVYAILYVTVQFEQ
jgi:hypothetical protein